eukprot:comp22818_c3_seq1/m.35833 comp22818_c3_seq1/g.35833  ORF comp22818_c3_seq1/g.35833 comp22818_c3_seq1/m.35833 type:complete len:465 (-) comp22818_c3_seq1:65-1459(-)
MATLLSGAIARAWKQTKPPALVSLALVQQQRLIQVKPWARKPTVKRRPPPPPTNALAGGIPPSPDETPSNPVEGLGKIENIPDVSASALVAVKSHVPQVPHAVLTSISPAAPLLEYPALVIIRKVELLNVLVGFEQANQYAIHNPAGQVVGYVAEKQSMGRALIRNILRNRRPFHAQVFDAIGNPVLSIERPFYFVNSKITVKDSQGREIGEAHMDWHLWRRRYDLFTDKRQFARIDAGFLSWVFDAVDKDGRELGRVDKDWAGFARELFTDGNMYSVKMDMLSDAVRVLTYDERATLLATAITIDSDYFSRHGGHGFMPMPIPVPMAGGAGTGGAVGAAGGAVGGVAEAGVIGGMAGMAETAGMGGAAMGGVVLGDAMKKAGGTAGLASTPTPGTGSAASDGMAGGMGSFGDASKVPGGPTTNQYGDEITPDVGFDTESVSGGDGEGIAAKLFEMVKDIVSDS